MLEELHENMTAEKTAEMLYRKYQKLHAKYERTMHLLIAIEQINKHPIISKLIAEHFNKTVTNVTKHE